MHSIPFSGILGTVHSGANLNKILSEVVKETLLSNSSSLESGNIFYLLGERMEIIASTNTMEVESHYSLIKRVFGHTISVPIREVPPLSFIRTLIFRTPIYVSAH